MSGDLKFKEPMGCMAYISTALSADMAIALRDLLEVMEDDQAKGTDDWCARADRAMDAARLALDNYYGSYFEADRVDLDRLRKAGVE